MMIPLISEISRDWHDSVTEDMRSQQIKKLIMGMQSPLNSSGEVDQDRLTSNAKISEKAMFEAACSRSEYYLMLAQEIYKFQKALELERKLTPSSAESSPAKVSPVYDESKSQITQELRHAYTSKFKEDLNPSPNLDDLARKAENLCFERASSLDDYYKYTADVYKVKRALEHSVASDVSPSCSRNFDASTIQDRVKTESMEVTGKTRGDTSDEDFNKEMMQLLSAVERQNLAEK